jgi:hypothetical protein
MQTKRLLNVRKGDCGSSLRKDRALAAIWLLLLIMTPFSLHAQVTIGGSTNPANGAILDLNSDVKGGLVLSNVAITAPTVIPGNFPDVNGANETAVKAGLTGAMVYNTNADLCTGVHVWNGDYWERIASNPIKAQGMPLTITSSTVNLIGGDVVEFAVATPAKTYTWYLTNNWAGYEHLYLATTTTPTYSGKFPGGLNTVSVIADNCQYLEESEVAFASETLSPSFGSIEGGNYIYIYGDFPHVSTDDYIQDGLVAHYDGINNQGLGDKQHVYDATSWKDLKNNFELPRLMANNGEWLSNGFRSLNTTIYGNNDVNTQMHNIASFYSNGFPASYPVGNAERTVEVIFRTPDETKMFTQQANIMRGLFGYGTLNVAAKSFSVIYRGLKYNSCLLEDPNNGWIFHAIGGNDNNLITCLCSTPSLDTPNTINTVTSTYQESIADPRTNSFINNTQAVIAERLGGSLNTGSTLVTIGFNLPYATFLSVRLYNRVLTAEEIEHNAAMDQKRYLNPPKVTVGGKECTEVVVLSSNYLICKVPEGESIGEVEVKVDGESYGNVYKYVDTASDFYITAISPIVGSANTTLTFTGGNLDQIDKVEAGGKKCDVSGTPTPTEYKCTLPSDIPPGETDIVITMKNGTVYRFAKMFEYE